MPLNKRGSLLPLKDSDYKQMNNFDLKVITKQVTKLNSLVNVMKRLAFEFAFFFRALCSVFFQLIFQRVR